MIRSTRGWIVGAALAGVGVAFVAPVFAHPSFWGISDWDQHLFYHEAARHTLVRFHELPLWNPFYCGGTVQLANPQSRVASPFFALVLALGAPAGLKVDLALHVLLGLAGMYALARHHGASRSAAALAAVVFRLNAAYAYNLMLGMSWYMTTSYLPWALLGAERGRSDPRWRWVAGGALAATVLGGGAYVVAMAAVFLVIHESVACVRDRDLRPLRSLVAIAAIALGLSAVKLVPTIAQLHAYPRAPDDHSGMSVEALVMTYLDPLRADASRTWHQPGGNLWHGVDWGIDENATYVGLAPVVLACLGAWAMGRRALPLWIACVAFAWITLGARAEPWSLWHALRALPILGNMRIAQRWRIVITLAIALAAAAGLDRARSWLTRRGRSALVSAAASAALVAWVAVDLLAVNGVLFVSAFPFAPMPIRPAERLVQHDTLRIRGYSDALAPDAPQLYTSSAHLPALLANVGIVSCYETARVDIYALPAESPLYRGEAFLMGATGTARLLHASPNRLVAAVHAEAPARVVVNQNWQPGWTYTLGAGDAPQDAISNTLPMPFARQLSAAVPTGESRVELRYRAPGLVAGSAVTALTLVTLVGSCVRRRRSRTRGTPVAADRAS